VDTVTLGTATPGGGFPVYGQALVETIAETDSTLAVQPQNTKGSTENVPLLEAGRLDLALVQGEVAYEALAGIGRAPADLRILAAMYSTPGMFVARGDSEYRTIADLTGRHVAFGARGSGLVILARYVLDGLGLEQDARLSTRSSWTLPAMGPPWCWTDAWPRYGAAASAGPASPRWRAARRGRASSCRTPTGFAASSPSTPFSSR
jgi:TRAP transporter TAXI family solute receptor